MLIRKCPNCNKDIKYKTDRQLRRSAKNNSYCKECKYIKTKKTITDLWKTDAYNGRKGQICTDDMKRNISNGLKDYWQSDRSTDHRNSICEYMTNRIVSNETKEKIRKFNEGANNPKVKQLLEKLNISADEYHNMMPEREKYYKAVWRVTKRQPLHMLENFEHRGRTTYHLDHKMSIIYGFLNNIPADIIGHIDNLQMLPYKENLKKGGKNLENRK